VRRLGQPYGRSARLARGRIRTPSADDLADYLDRLAREVRSGRSLTAAVADIATPPGIDAATRQPDVAVVRQALSAAARMGGPIAPALDAAAAVLRERAALAADVVAQSAQARLSARILTLVPLGFAAWSAITSARTRSAYVHSAVGMVCASSGLLLNVAGWWWMRRIVRSAA
jgi:tight adherence protein B